METLYALGLTENERAEYENQYGQYFLGRVSVEYRNSYKVMTENGELMARVSGKLNYSAHYRSDYPTVGDWVVMDKDESESGDAVIHGILNRKSMFSRKVVGKKSEEQAIAANIDTVFICMAFGHDYNLRRLERYLSIAWDSGAKPVVILTKSDLSEHMGARFKEVDEIAIGIDVLAVSNITKNGVDEVMHHIKPRETVAFIGSSGVGKSTLINTLLGEERQKVDTVRKDEKGKHTTSYRELIKLPQGGIVIDTPGMREIQIYHADLDVAFSDIVKLAENCHFSDCIHETEPRCAVKNAITEGKLTEERLESYKKLRKEIEYMVDREHLNSKQLEKKKIINMIGSLDAIKKMKESKQKE